MSTTPRLFNWLLRLYPPAVRVRFGQSLLETVEERLTVAQKTRGRVGWAAAAASEAGGMVKAAISERFHHASRRDGARPKTRRRRPPWTAALRRDLRHARANLRRSPMFTVTALATLAIGIGGNTAIFSVVHGIVMRPLPYPESDRLVFVDHGAAGIGVSAGLGITRGMYIHYRNRATAFDEIAAYQSADLALTGVGRPSLIHGAMATWTLGATLRVTPIHGRWLDATDRDDRVPVVVLGFDLWRNRFGADPDVVGRTVQLAGVSREVIGIMPGGFAFPDHDTSFWIPRVIDPNTTIGGFNLLAVARLAPGATVETAAADLRSALTTLVEAFPDGNARGYLEDARVTPRVSTLIEHEVGHVARGLWVLLGTMGLVLVIVCANVGNLFLVRAESRRREVALRSALGATRGDLVRLFLVESTVITLAGAVLGTLLASLALRALVVNGPAYLPRLGSVRLDGPSLTYAFLVSLLVCVVFAGVPLGQRMTSLTDALRASGRGSTAGRSAFRLRQFLAAGQVAAAAVLLTAGGLMVRSYWSLLRVDPGFRGDETLTFGLGLPGTRYPNRDAATRFQQEALDRLRALPGVSAAGLVSCLPLDGWCWGDPLSVDGRAVPEGTIPPVVAARVVSDGYFEAMGIPILAGRSVERTDQEKQTNAVVVSRKLADLYFPDEEPLGKRVALGAAPSNNQWFEIVGISGDVPARSLQRGPDPIAYFAMRVRGTGLPPTQQMTAVLRTSIPATDLMPVVRRAVGELDPNLPLANVRTLNGVLRDASAEMAFTMVVIGIAGLTALLLSVVGVYGVVAYVVAQRRSEIGVRAALGATAADIRRLVTRQSVTMSLGGATVGLTAAVLASRVMQSLLFGVAPTDARTYLGVATVLIGIAWLAGLGPARSAAAVDPADAIRAD